MWGAVPPGHNGRQVMSHNYLGHNYVGHNYLGAVPPGHNGRQVPYHDNDFEAFIDPSMSTAFYKEFEMNVRNASYDVNLGVPAPFFFIISEHADGERRGPGSI